MRAPLPSFLASREPLLVLVLALIAVGLPGGAYLALRAPRLRTSTADLAEELARSGDRRLRQGQVRGAIELYSRSLEASPNSAAALHGLGRAHRALDRPDRAADFFRRVIAIDPEATDAVTWLGDTELRLGNVERSIELYSRAIVIEPWNGFHHRGLGRALQANGDNGRAILAFRDALRFLAMGSADYITAFHGLSGSCRAASRTAGQAELVARLRQDRSGSGLLAAAELHFHAGAFASARTAYLHALKREPDNGFVHKGLGWSAHFLGDHADARRHFRRALELLARSSIDRDDAAAGLAAATRASAPR